MDSVATDSSRGGTRVGIDLPGDVLPRIAKALGKSLVGWRATVVEPTDEGYLLGYELQLTSDAGVDSSQLVFVETHPREGSRRGVLVLPIDNGTVAVWIYPNDPDLPSLASLVDASSATTVLGSLGIGAAASSTAVIAYRPGKRAVVRVNSETEHLYLKVLEPAKAAAIAERHQLFSSSGLPVPRLLGWSRDGLVALSELPGVEAHSALPRIGDHDKFIDSIEKLSARIAEVPAINMARASLSKRADWYVARLTERLPERTEEIAETGRRIDRLRAKGNAFPSTPVTIHGDLHLGQLFVDSDDPASITGVLDIDTAGSGDPADDAAALYAHLVALGVRAETMNPRYAFSCFDIASRWLGRWPRNRNSGFDARARAIAATHLLGHALRPDDGEAASVRLLECAGALVSKA
jgi:aminoglycoside phosphotransferase